MWTDRKKVLKKYEEIIKYIDSMIIFMIVELVI